MRWRPMDSREPDDWLHISLAVVTAPLWIPLVAGLAVLFGLAWLKRRALGPTDQWRPWFAWYPVKVGAGGIRSNWADQTVWLETVERRSFAVLSEIDYRLKESAHDQY